MPVSVIIPTFNRPPFLNLCLSALEKQTYLPDEVLVTARHSDKHTINFLNRFSSASELNIKILKINRPGFVPPVKEGVSKATGSYIALIDDDMVLPPDWIENALNFFDQSTPDIGVLTGGAICARFPNADIYPAVLKWYGAYKGIEKAVSEKKKIKICKKLAELNAFLENNVIFRRDAIKPEYLDETLDSGALAHHGLDTGLKITKTGWKILYCPFLSGNHLVARQPISKQTIENTKSYIDNIFLITKSNLGFFALIRYMLFLLILGQHQSPGLLRFFLRNDSDWRRILFVQKESLMLFAKTIK